MRVGESFLIFYLLVQLAGILRLIGIADVPAIVLAIYRAMDFITIAFFLIFWRNKVKIRGADFLILLVATYPILVGLAREQINVTFFNDSAIYIGFILKIIIYRTLIASIIKRYEMDYYFSTFLRKFIPISVAAAAAAFLIGQFFAASGQLKYYQTPAEITLTAAVALAYNKFWLFLFFALFAAGSGKRMIMAGMLAIIAFASVTSRRIMKIFFRWLPRVLVGGLIATIVLLLSGHLDGLAFVDKINTTYETAIRAFSEANSLDAFFQRLEPARYIEFMSLRDQIQGIGVALGNGYGFRYELNADLLSEFGYDATEGGDVSNAHFTPIAIVSKFGVIGLVAWSIYLFSTLISGIKAQRQSRFKYACTLALASYLIQSLFAFGFFINLLTPFVLAVVSTKTSRERSTVSLSSSGPVPQINHRFS